MKRLILLLGLLVSPDSFAQPVIYGLKGYNEDKHLASFSPGASEADSVAGGLAGAINIEWDERTRTLWIADWGGLGRMDEFGSSFATVVPEGEYHPGVALHGLTGIAFNHDADRIYASGDNGWVGEYWAVADLSGNLLVSFSMRDRGIYQGFDRIYYDPQTQQGFGAGFGLRIGWLNAPPSHLVRVDLDTAVVRDTLATVGAMVDWDVDRWSRMIYWAELDSVLNPVLPDDEFSAHWAIKRLSLDGGPTEEVLSLDGSTALLGSHLNAMAVDGKRNQLYIAGDVATYRVDIGDTTLTPVGPGGLRSLVVVEPDSPSPVETVAARGHLEIYPNPSTGQVTVSSDLSNPSTLEIYDLLGRLVRSSGVASGSSRVTFSGLSPGAYFVRVGRESRGLIVR